MARSDGRPLRPRANYSRPRDTLHGLSKTYKGPGPLLLIPQCAVGSGLQISIDEAVQIAVHNGADVAHLKAGPVVFHQGIGHEHVGADPGCPKRSVLARL